MLLGLLFSFILGTNFSHASELIKVASWNFNSEVVPEDRASALREHRFEALVNWVNAQSPDIIFIEEGWNFRGYPTVAIPLADAVGYELTYRLTMGLNGFLLDSNAVLIKKGFHFDETHNFKLPHHAPTIGNGSSWIVSLGATSWGVGGRITTPKGNPVYAYATHLIASKEAERADDLQGLHALIEQEITDRGENPAEASIVIAGDFNAHPESSVLSSILEKGYADTFAGAHPSYSPEEACTECSDPTSPLFNPLTIGPGEFPAQNDINGNEHIDYVLVKAKNYLPLASTLIFTEPMNGVWMSDHYGVMSTFLFGLKGDDLVQAIANPERDETRPREASQIVEVTDDNLTCDEDGCWHDLPDLLASTATGVTYINHSTHKIKVVINGDADIWPRNFAKLPPGKVAAFFFGSGAHHFDYEISRPLSRKKLFGSVDTHTL